MNLTRNRFVPSHSARHRTAALALYRALVKAARAVPLPPSIHATTTASPAAEGSGSAGAKRHAVAQLVRRRFDRNKLDTSLRLVYYSMTVGYKVRIAYPLHVACYVDVTVSCRTNSRKSSSSHS